MEYVNTLREIFNNPEDVIDTFVLEEKTKFQHPFSFGLISVLIIVALYLLVFGYRTPTLVDIVSEDIDQYQQLTYWIQYANLKVSTVLLPLSMVFLLTLSLSITGLFFFRDNIDGFYYNLILSAYAVSAAVLALLILVPVWFIFPSTLFDPFITTYLPLILVGVVVIRIYQVYFLMEGIQSWVQIISSYVLGSFIFLLLENFSASIIGYFLFAINQFIDIWLKM